MRQAIEGREARCVVLRGSPKVLRRVERTLHDVAAVLEIGEAGRVFVDFEVEENSEFSVETVATWREDGEAETLSLFPELPELEGKPTKTSKRRGGTRCRTDLRGCGRESVARSTGKSQ